MEASFSSNKPYMLRAVYEWILDNDATPYLLVDATEPSVTVPTQHIQNGQIILNVEPNAIQDWFSDNDAISFSARFSGKAMNIFIPMSALLAIYAQENGLGMAFPPEENNETSSSSADKNASVEAISEKSEAAKVRAVELNTQEKDLEEQSKDLKEDVLEEVISNKSKQKSHLKVVK